MVRGDAKITKDAINRRDTHIIKEIRNEAEIVVNESEPRIVWYVPESVSILIEGDKPALRPQAS